MRKAYLLLLALVYSALAANAQDIITLTNGTHVQAKVLEINPGDVKYKDYNNVDGPIITIQKSDVSAIQYANGVKTVLNNGSSTNAGSEGYKRENGAHRGGGYRREVYNSSRGYKKKSEKNAKLGGWYFGMGMPIGISNATSSDPTYTTAGGVYNGLDLFAAKMFNQHFGVMFGLGAEAYSYNINLNGSSNNPYDGFSLACLTVPVRAIYISNSKSKAGLYVMAGLDLSLLLVAKDEEGDDLKAYYNSVLLSPYLGSGVAIRTRNARAVWMFGLYYKTTVSNCYSGKSDNGNLYAPGNTGLLNSAGISVEFMGKFGKHK